MSGVGDRMKWFENAPKTRLTPRVPVVGRVDGKNFHTFLRDLDKPWDARYHSCLWDAALYLCENIQGSRIAYAYSDEITLVLRDDLTPHAEPWFDYELQKICSVAASMATAAFLAAFLRRFPERLNALSRGDGLPAFDARFWNLPIFEIPNLLTWRQQDATRASLHALARSEFSHDELVGLDAPRLHDKLMLERGVNWNDRPTAQKRGACVIYKDGWLVDDAPPIFTRDPDYLATALG